MPTFCLAKTFMRNYIIALETPPPHSRPRQPVLLKFCSVTFNFEINLENVIVKV